ncbi:YndM family protein [Dethiobacter alkaliphilus]|uniref:YndM family protein n=1 Tax=Dethiobacter alkaliphilus TaxID=427926 RepID=UPI002226420C|nr:YndM family protein [Dethiobacter alkaliphilus]MCW3489443.1 YndM family protein [Dethiobacter alkaliphilus]
MRTYLALGIKFAMTLFAAAVAALISGLTDWWLILLVGLVGAIVNFILGDMVILPGFGNIVATIGDGITSALLAYVIIIRQWAGVSVLLFAISFGILVMIGEYFFHRYLKGKKLSTNPLE